MFGTPVNKRHLTEVSGTKTAIVKFGQNRVCFIKLFSKAGLFRAGFLLSSKKDKFMPAKRGSFFKEKSALSYET